MKPKSFIKNRRVVNPEGFRSVCPTCRKAKVTCYCAQLKPFAAPFPIVILQHPAEARNAIATARMAHLSLTNSRLFVGKDFTNHGQVNRLLADRSFRHVLLYPHPTAMDLDQCFEQAASTPDQSLMLWVLDAKWCQINQILRESTNLRGLPFVKFTPAQESQFRIRQQPRPQCLSTIESIHVVLEHFHRRRSNPCRNHDGLMTVFRHLVEQQLDFFAKNGAILGTK